MSETEAKETALIRRVFSSGYSHAENLVREYHRLAAERGHEAAIETLYEQEMG